MMRIRAARRDRYNLLTAAHRFLFEALPFRHSASRRALDLFIDAVRSCPLPMAEVNAVLIELLAVLNPHAAGCLPSLVERYLEGRERRSEALTRFRDCVDDVITYRGIGNVTVQQAIEIIEDRFCETTLTPSAIAELLTLQTHEFGVLFKKQMDVSCTEYLRNVRLDRAATLLITTNRTIKEIWVEVAYNDASNFNHLFKRRFGVSPREYRARFIQHDALGTGEHSGDAHVDLSSVPTRQKSATILIVDDDRGTCDTLRIALRLAGYQVVVAFDGETALECDAQIAADVVLIDFHLGDMDGLECLRRLRRRQGEAQHPSAVIFTADLEVEEQADEISALGAVLVSKLCDIDEIALLVASLC
jgi:AraC-like DNA-binding protein/CheY-like chemotaxis protein